MSENKEKKEQRLVLLVGIINQNPSLFNLEKGKRFTLKDFDSLTPEFIHKILIFLLSDLNLGAKEFTMQQEIKPLPNISDLAVFSKLKVHYDASLDRLFWTVRKYFPEADDTFNYSHLIINGAKGIKNVLSYLCLVNFFFESIRERFSNVWDEISEDNREKVAIYSEIEGLKEGINKKAYEIENWNEEVQYLEYDLLEQEKTIQDEQAELDALEAQLKRAKKIFQEKEGENREIERRIKQVERDIKDVEDSIVLSPSQISYEQQSETATLAALENQRENLGNNINSIIRKEQQYSSLIEEANEALKTMSTINNDMESTNKLIGTFQKVKQEQITVKKEIEAQDAISSTIIESKEKSTKNIKLKKLKIEQSVIQLKEHLKEKIKEKNVCIQKNQGMKGKIMEKSFQCERLKKEHLNIKTANQKAKEYLKGNQAALEMHKKVDDFPKELLKNYMLDFEKK